MKIHLNDTTSIDLDKLIESRMLIQANSGGGKSHTTRRIIEQVMAAKNHPQVIVLDPEGEYSNLRTKYDFVYVGKGGDAPADPRSAALLARRLLELKASAIIDLYELPPQDRKHFVRLFCEAMVNAPKELWHDCLVVIDEAHVFAPENGQSESTGPVIDLATRGRKRGYCAILATQRLSKLHKDAAAECNNKLVGRTTLDIDRKRASEELGFTTKDDVRSLRDLNPGEFFVFGPAIGRDVERIVVGSLNVQPPKRGVSRSVPPKPTAAVKAILAKLADLPQEAQEEVNTINGLRNELRAVKGELKFAESIIKGQSDGNKAKFNDSEPVRAVVDRAVAKAIKETEDRKNAEMFELNNKYLEQVDNWFKIMIGIAEAMKKVKAENVKFKPKSVERKKNPGFFGKPTPDGVALHSTAHDLGFYKRSEAQFVPPRSNIVEATTSPEMGRGERDVLIAIAQHDGMSREHITVQTAYKQSTRNAYIQRLQQKGYVDIDGEDAIRATEVGIQALGNDYKPLPTGPELVTYHLQSLPDGESKILEILLSAGVPLTREQISDQTGFKPSTRNAYIQRLRTRQLVNLRGDMIKVSDYLV